MKNPLRFIVVLLVALVAAFGYFDWQRERPESLQQVRAPAASAAQAASAPASSAPTSAPASAPVSAPELALPASSAQPLPELGESDAAMGKAIAGLIGRQAFVAWLIPHRLVMHIVATIDNLPRAQVPAKAWPVKPVPGAFRTVGTGAGLAISPDNAPRYADDMRILESVEPRRLVDVYLAFYPLFERAYRQLGYPQGDFNARLLAVIDNLLAAPEPQAPIRLTQPHVLYQYADPALESASAGQKILMRMGARNEALVKAKLRAIKQELARHMRPAGAKPAS